ncbi:MAG: hypothetical protein RJS97_00810 [Parvibaculaceae bacterium]
MKRTSEIRKSPPDLIKGNGLIRKEAPPLQPFSARPAASPALSSPPPVLGERVYGYFNGAAFTRSGPGAGKGGAMRRRALHLSG